MGLPSVKEKAEYVCTHGLVSGYIREVYRETNVCI